MKKKELELAQRAYRQDGTLSAPRTYDVDSAHGASTAQLRAKVSKDLNVVKDAYDTAALALAAVSVRLAQLGFDGESATEQVRSLGTLTKSIGELTKALVSLRAEGRATIREATEADPPIPDGQGAGGAVLTPHEKISLPHGPPIRGPAIGEYLTGVTAPEDNDDD